MYDYSAIFERIKSTDFPLKCRGMYYFSKGRHAHQERKGSGKPYFVHPRGVAYIVMEHGDFIRYSPKTDRWVVVFLNDELCHLTNGIIVCVYHMS